MQLVTSRTYSFLVSVSLEERSARDCLFRSGEGTFLLYMKSYDGAEDDDDRVIWFDSRTALL
jgi:hypothetical protein